MTVMIIIGSCLVWLTGAVAMGRRKYRSKLAELKDAKVPAVYGGPGTWMSEAEKDRRAMSDAYKMMFCWPFSLTWDIFEALIRTKYLFGVPDSKTDPWSSQPEDDPLCATHHVLEDDLEQALKAEERKRNPDPMRDALLTTFDMIKDMFDREQDPVRRDALLQRAQMVRDLIKSDEPGNVTHFVSGTSEDYRRWAVRRAEKMVIVPDEFIAPCVCGYTTECAVHCGNGHETGACPTRHTARLSEILTMPRYEDET